MKALLFCGRSTIFETRSSALRNIIVCLVSSGFPKRHVSVVVAAWVQVGVCNATASAAAATRAIGTAAIAAFAAAASTAATANSATCFAFVPVITTRRLTLAAPFLSEFGVLLVGARVTHGVLARAFDLRHCLS